MHTSARSIRDNRFRTVLAATSLVIAFAAMSTRANAEAFVDPVNQITVSAPIVKYVNNDAMIGAPRREIRVTARVKTDPVMLTTNSGLALFKESVAEAARRACGADDAHGGVDQSCVRVTLKKAKPQMDAIIATARIASND